MTPPGATQGGLLRARLARELTSIVRFVTWLFHVSATDTPAIPRRKRARLSPKRQRRPCIAVGCRGRAASSLRYRSALPIAAMSLITMAILCAAVFVQPPYLLARARPSCSCTNACSLAGTVAVPHGVVHMNPVELLPCSATFQQRISLSLSTGMAAVAELSSLVCQWHRSGGGLRGLMHGFDSSKFGAQHCEYLTHSSASWLLMRAADASSRPLKRAACGP